MKKRRTPQRAIVVGDVVQAKDPTRAIWYVTAIDGEGDDARIQAAARVVAFPRTVPRAAWFSASWFRILFHAGTPLGWDPMTY